MAILAVDAGTTHCKAGLFSEDGRALRIASQEMPVLLQDGEATIEPDRFWRTVQTVLQEALDGAREPVTVAGVASMAETGLLVDRRSGKERTPLYLWYDQRSQPQAAKFEPYQEQQFTVTGLRPSFKCSLARLLWLREAQQVDLDGSVWLSVADYITFRLTGSLASDPTLAGRTYAYDIAARAWDGNILERWGINSAQFPPTLASGSPAGKVRAGASGLPAGTLVAICGHDHVCAAFAAIANGDPGQVFDSMGTAEALVGLLPEEVTRLGKAAFQSGLSYGCAAVPGRLYWMGGLSASGGSLEWMRQILGEPALPYTELERLCSEAGEEPGEILFFPYLAGRGAPHTDPSARGAFTGLRLSHRRADLVKAVLEGTAYEVEQMRRAAEATTGMAVQFIRAAGGGTRNPVWMQVKADVTGCRYEVMATEEATLLGAALLAGAGCGVYSGLAEAASLAAREPGSQYVPNEARHEHYQQLFSQAYLPMQASLQAIDVVVNKHG